MLPFSNKYLYVIELKCVPLIKWYKYKMSVNHLSCKLLYLDRDKRILLEYTVVTIDPHINGQSIKFKLDSLYQTNVFCLQNSIV